MALLCFLAAHADQQMEQSEFVSKHSGAVPARIRTVRGAVENAAHSVRGQAGPGSIEAVCLRGRGRPRPPPRRAVLSRDTASKHP